MATRIVVIITGGVLYRSEEDDMQEEDYVQKVSYLLWYYFHAGIIFTRAHNFLAIFASKNTQNIILLHDSIAFYIVNMPTHSV